MKKNKSGFTIVELLIVIVVIAILAAISIVAYNGIQQRARDTERTSEISGIQKALELYYVDNGAYPSVGSDNIGYELIDLSSALVPKYINSIPADPKPTAGSYNYVRGAANATSYGIRINYEGRTHCHRGVNNAGIGWWSLSAC